MWQRNTTMCITWRPNRKLFLFSSLFFKIAKLLKWVACICNMLERFSSKTLREDDWIRQEYGEAKNRVILEENLFKAAVTWDRDGRSSSSRKSYPKHFHIECIYINIYIIGNSNTCCTFQISICNKMWKPTITFLPLHYSVLLWKR